MIDTDRYEGYTNCDLRDLFTHSEMADKVLLLLAEVKDLQKKLDNLRNLCNAEDYDIFNWEIKNIEVIE
ncbi:MAG: hypothetical protein Tp1100DCM51572_62 [Prokaryotic dsDNA virus sp.]|nr:MAG: hypothetical protein Tp1100DCM51572_62 [Prokaryotic dsDNA virus sp.]